MRNDWEMVFVDSGAKALEILAQFPFDVVVSDMRMPLMDGAQLLTEVMHRYPQVVRIVLSGHSDKDYIVKSVRPVHQFLSKPCDPDTLKAKITRTCALHDLLKEPTLRQIVAQMSSLPSIPAVYQELLKELESPNVSVQRLGEIIARDVGITTKILQMVNSAFFGLSRSVANLTMAVSLLGLETIKALVLSVEIFAKFDKVSVPGFSIDELWQHSFATGNLAKQITVVEKGSADDQNNGFMGGLLHDVGKLILAINFPQRYGKMLTRVREQKLSQVEAEMLEFGASHGEIGAYLLGIWGLPDHLVEVLAYHHTLAKSPVQDFCPIVVVHVANVFESLPSRRCLKEDYSAALDWDAIKKLNLSDRVPIWFDLYEKSSASGERA